MMKTGSNILAGEAIILSKPFAIVLFPAYQTIYCNYCCLKGSLKKCSGCGVDYYCSVDCQKSDWHLTHKSECKKLKKFHNFKLSTRQRLVAKIILRLMAEDNLSEIIEEGFSRSFTDLMTHEKEISKDAELTEEILKTTAILTTYFSRKIKLPNLLPIYGAVITNAYSITDNELNSIGVGMYLAASVLDHSCRPSAATIFEGRDLIVRALEDIPAFQWQKATISYAELVECRSLRRQRLEKSHYFSCNCRRCADEKSFEDEDTLLCVKGSCGATVRVSSPPLSDKETLPKSLICWRCGDKFPENICSIYWKLVSKWTELIEKKYEEDKKMSLDECLGLLTEQQSLTIREPEQATVEPFNGSCKQSPFERYWKNAQSCLLHPCNIWRVKVLDACFEVAIASEMFTDAFALGLLNLQGMSCCHGENHPTFGYFLAKLGKLSLYLCQAEQATKLLTRAVGSLRVAYGPEHSVCTTTVRLLQEATAELSRLR